MSEALTMYEDAERCEWVYEVGEFKHALDTSWDLLISHIDILAPLSRQRRDLCGCGERLRHIATRNTKCAEIGTEPAGRIESQISKQSVHKVGGETTPHSCTS